MEPVADFVPESDFAQDLLDAVGDVALLPTVFLEGDLEVPPDRLREGIGALKDDPDASAQIKDVGLRIGDLGAVTEADGTGHTAAGDEIGESVEAKEKAGFSTSRCADEGGDFALGNFQIDVSKGGDFAVGNGESSEADGGWIHGFSWRLLSHRSEIATAAAFTTKMRARRTRALDEAMGAPLATLRARS